MDILFQERREERERRERERAKNDFETLWILFAGVGKREEREEEREEKEKGEEEFEEEKEEEEEEEEEEGIRTRKRKRDFEEAEEKKREEKRKKKEKEKENKKEKEKEKEKDLIELEEDEIDIKWKRQNLHGWTLPFDPRLSLVSSSSSPSSSSSSSLPSSSSPLSSSNSSSPSPLSSSSSSSTSKPSSEKEEIEELEELRKFLSSVPFDHGANITWQRRYEKVKRRMIRGFCVCLDQIVDERVHLKHQIKLDLSQSEELFVNETIEQETEEDPSFTDSQGRSLRPTVARRVFRQLQDSQWEVKEPPVVVVEPVRKKAKILPFECGHCSGPLLPDHNCSVCENARIRCLVCYKLLGPYRTHSSRQNGVAQHGRLCKGYPVQDRNSEQPPRQPRKTPRRTTATTEDEKRKNKPRTTRKGASSSPSLSSPSPSPSPSPLSKSSPSSPSSITLETSKEEEREEEEEEEREEEEEKEEKPKREGRERRERRDRDRREKKEKKERKEKERVGKRTWSAEDIDAFLDISKEMVPHSLAAWDDAAIVYNQRYASVSGKPERNGRSLRDKFESLCKLPGTYHTFAKELKKEMIEKRKVILGIKD